MYQAKDQSGKAAGKNPPTFAIHAMTPGVIQIPGDVSVGEAARLMHKEQAPCVLIKDSDTRIGLMTHTDIVYKVVAQGLNPDDVEARRIMSSPVRSVEFDQPMEEVSTMMASTGAPLVIVTRQQQPIGVISAHDLVLSPSRCESHLQATIKVYNEKPEGVMYPAVITQLSHLGAFVETSAVMSPGARVTVEFVVPDSKRPIAVEAVVLEPGDHQGSMPQPCPHSAAGIGIRFTDVSVPDQSQISAWIIRTRSRSSGDI